jgi:hypothetical protein
MLADTHGIVAGPLMIALEESRLRTCPSKAKLSGCESDI